MTSLKYAEYLRLVNHGNHTPSTCATTANKHRATVNIMAQKMRRSPLNLTKNATSWQKKTFHFDGTCQTNALAA